MCVIQCVCVLANQSVCVCVSMYGKIPSYHSLGVVHLFFNMSQLVDSCFIVLYLSLLQ